MIGLDRELYVRCVDCKERKLDAVCDTCPTCHGEVCGTCTVAGHECAEVEA